MEIDITLKELKLNRIKTVVKDIVKNHNRLNKEEIINTIAENSLIYADYKGWDIVESIHHQIELERFKLSDDTDYEVNFDELEVTIIE